MLTLKADSVNENAVGRIPKKITPDSLLDTFVQVHYLLRIEKEILLSSANELFDSDFSLVKLSGEIKQSPEFRDDEILFSGRGIFFRIREKFVSFTCSEGYIGWVKYRPLIQDVLQRMYDANWISAFPRISIRFINSLPWAPLGSQVKLKFPELPHLPKSEHTLYQTSGYNPGGFQIDVVLTDNARLAGSDEEPVSLFDIGVAKTTPIPMESLQEALSELDKAHTIEKEVFFGMLSPEFLATLNPEY